MPYCSGPLVVASASHATRPTPVRGGVRYVRPAVRGPECMQYWPLPGFQICFKICLRAQRAKNSEKYLYHVDSILKIKICEKSACLYHTYPIRVARPPPT